MKKYAMKNKHPKQIFVSIQGEKKDQYLAAFPDLAPFAEGEVIAVYELKNTGVKRETHELVTKKARKVKKTKSGKKNK